MLGNFSYHNPTKLYFGEESLGFLKDELKKYGSNVQGYKDKYWRYSRTC